MSLCRILQCIDVAAQANVTIVSLHYVIFAINTRFSFESFFQWKRTKVSVIYGRHKRMQFLKLQAKHPKGSMSLSFLVLLVSLSNFSSTFHLLVAD